jgi:hypothetical protein
MDVPSFPKFLLHHIDIREKKQGYANIIERLARIINCGKIV